MIDLAGVPESLNGLAGAAALVNGLLLWPIVRSLKASDTAHASRLATLEKRKARRKTQARAR